MAEPIKRKTRPDTGEVGFTGANRIAGLMREEYLPALRGVAKVNAYTRMRADGMIQAILSAITLPIVAAGWTVEPAGTDANAKRAAQLVEELLFSGPGAWEEEVRKALTYQVYGFQVLAKNWGVEKGRMVLRDLRQLHPRTLVAGNSWQFAERGRLTGVYQTGNDGQTYCEELIPRESFVHLVREGDFGDPEGRSVLRGAYKHLLIVDRLYLWNAIGFQRGAVGVLIAKYAPNATNAKDALATFCKNMQVSESGYLVTGVGNEVEQLKVQLEAAAMKAMIEHHKGEMARSVLAMWLTQGQNGTGGSYNIIEGQSDLFLLTLESIGDYVANVFNREVIRELVSYNLDTDQYPRLSCTISRRSAEQLANLVAPLTAGANPALTWGDGDEDELRERLQLPPRQGPRPAPQAPPPPPGDPAPEPGTDGQARQERERIRIAGEPPRYQREEPAFQAMADLIGECHGQIVSLSDRLRERVWLACALPDSNGQASRPRLFARGFALSDEQKRALDKAIEWFLGELAGKDRTEKGFVGADVEDALLQHYELLGHAVGLGRAKEMTGAETNAFHPTRESPEIQRLLSGAFTNLSEGGRLRLEDYLAAIKDYLVTGAEQGMNPIEVGRRLSTMFDQYNRHEWERLARTEMAYAANSGIVDELHAEGVQWMRPLIGAMACEVCQAHVGERIPVEGAVAGRGGNIAPYHPHCVCSIQND